MKKTVSLLLAAILCFCLAASVCADMGAPTFYEYDGYVNKADGIYTYEPYGDSAPKFLPYGTELHIIGTYVIDGVQMLNCTDGDGYFYVSVQDVTPADTYPTDVKMEKLDHPLALTVINKAGVDFYDYSSETFLKVGTIPYGEAVTVEYGIDSYGDSLTWGYVTYNGKSGWLNVSMNGFSYNVGMRVSEDDLYTGKLIVLKKGVSLYDSPGFTSYSENVSAHTLVQEVAVGTELSFRVYYRNSHCIDAYVTYNGVSGWIVAAEYYNGDYCSSVGCGENSALFVTAEDGISLQESNDCRSRVLKTIPNGSVIKVKYTAQSYYNPATGKLLESDDVQNIDDYRYYRNYYITYDGISGWVNARGDRGLCYSNYISTYRNGSDSMTVRAERDTASAVLCTIPAGATFEYVAGDERSAYYTDSVNDRYAFVRYNGQCGWISDFDSRDMEWLSEQYNVVGKLADCFTQVEEETTSELPMPDLGAPSTTQMQDFTVSPNTQAESPRRNVLIVILIAIIVSSSAAVMLLLIKKRK